MLLLLFSINYYLFIIKITTKNFYCTMSNVYIQEPPTSGKIILITTYGELEIELWA